MEIFAEFKLVNTPPVDIVLDVEFIPSTEDPGPTPGIPKLFPILCKEWAVPRLAKEAKELITF